jgi:hypothetical protein
MHVSIRGRVSPSIAPMTLVGASCTNGAPQSQPAASAPISQPVAPANRPAPPARNRCEANGERPKSTGRGEIIRHYRDRDPAVPTWEAPGGTKDRADLASGSRDQSVNSATADSIPRLGLTAASGSGNGTFGSVSYATTQGADLIQPIGRLTFPGERGNATSV